MAIPKNFYDLTRKIFLSVGVVLNFGIMSCKVTKSEERRGIAIADSSAYEATLFRQNCAICHGAEAHGKTINGTRVPSLRFGEPAARTESEIYDQIANGKLPMPSFKGQLTESEMRRLAKFIKEKVQGRKE